MSRDITNHDDVIDSRDVISRLEELEALRKPWCAGWNMPGYMPDSEPCGFETFDEARDYIVSEMERWADEVQPSETEQWLAGRNGETDQSERDSLLEASKRWSDIETEGEQGETVGKYHYWIAEVSGAEAFDDEDEGNEYIALKALADEAEAYSEDWTYGSTLIRDSYFSDYVQELLEDCGDLPKDLPHYVVVDWEATARNIRQDYTSVDFDGVTYWVR